MRKQNMIMSYVMLVVVMVALIAATVAWFFYYHAAAVNGLNTNIASTDSLKLEVKQGEQDAESNFVELEAGKEDEILAWLDMLVFENVESYEITVGASDAQTKTVSKMAPGVYGSVTIRLTALQKQMNRYQLVPQSIFQYVGSLSVDPDADTGLPAEEQSDPVVSMLQALSQGHILFFTDRIERHTDTDDSSDSITVDGVTKAVTEYTHNDKYAFAGQIDAEHPMTGELAWDDAKQEGIPETVTVYWYWPYEYTNLSSTIQGQISLTGVSAADIVTTKRLRYFDKDRLSENAAGTGSWSEIQLYDYADTSIGNYVEKIRLQLKVEGYHAEETQAGPTE